MKKIELAVVKIEEGAKIDYREQILTVLKSPSNPQAGVDYAEMEKVLPIIAKVREAEDVVLLEDAEHKEICDRMKSARFGTSHEALFDMIKAIMDAPEHKVLKDANAQ